MHQPDRIAVTPGARGLALPVTMNAAWVALKDGHIGNDVRGVGESGRAAARNAAVGQLRQASRVDKVTLRPGTPRGGTDDRGEQRMVRIGGGRHPLGPIGDLVAQPPGCQFGRGCDQAQRKVDVAVRHRMPECRPQVVVVGQHPLHPVPLLGTEQANGATLGQLGEIRRVPHRIAIGDSLVLQALTPVGPQGCQYAIAGPLSGTAHGHHRLVDQTGQQLERVVLTSAIGPAHPVRSLQIERTREHRKPGKQRLFGFGEQPIRPVDGLRQALLPRRRSPHTAGQMMQLVKAPSHVGSAHHAHPRRREFHSQRQAVDPPADLGHRTRRLILQPEVRPTGPRSLGEQLYGVFHRRRVSISTIRSPSMLSGCLLVADAETRAQRRTMCSTNPATAATTCSQLSTSNRPSCPRRYSITDCSMSRPGCRRSPTAAATA